MTDAKISTPTTLQPANCIGPPEGKIPCTLKIHPTGTKTELGRPSLSTSKPGYSVAIHL